MNKQYKYGVPLVDDVEDKIRIKTHQFSKVDPLLIKQVEE